MGNHCHLAPFSRVISAFETAGFLNVFYAEFVVFVVAFCAIFYSVTSLQFNITMGVH